MTEQPISFAELMDVVLRARALREQGLDTEALLAADLAREGLPGIPVPDTAEGAQTLNLLGMTYFDTGYARKAELFFESALALAEGLQPPDEELLGNLLNNLGQVRLRLGSALRAKSLLERSVALREADAPDSVVLAVTLDNLGAAHSALHELSEAEASHSRALDIFQRQLGLFDGHVGTTLGNLSRVFLAQRELDRAEVYRLRALDIHLRQRGAADPDTLLDLSELVRVLLAKGDQERVDQVLNHMLAIGGSTPEPSHRFLAEMLSALAETMFADFRLDMAERTASRAVELLEALEGPHAPETLRAVLMLGNVQHATNDFDAAERNLRRALDGFDAERQTDDAIGALIDLAKLYRSRGAYPVAERLLSDAVSRLRQAPESHRQNLVSALGNLAESYYEVGRYDLAERAYDEALDAIRDPDSEWERPFLLHGRGLLAYHLGRYRQAGELYAEARRLWAERLGPEHPFVATALANLALVHWATGDVEQALDAFSESAATRDRDLRRILTVGSERKRLAYARQMLSDLHKVLSFNFAVSPPDTRIARFAAQQALERKGRVLDAVAHSVRLTRETHDADTQTLLAQLQAVRSEVTGLVTPTPRTRRQPPPPRRLAELREEEERLETALSYRGALQDPNLEPVALESVQGALPADGALVDLVVFRVFNPLRRGSTDAWQEDHYAALVVRASGEPRWFDLGPVAAIDALVDELRRLLRSPSSALQDCAAKSSEVYELLVAPLEDALGDAEKLLISPDGALTLLPFGFLRRRDGDRLVVSYLTGGRELLRLTVVSGATNGVIVVAAPDYDAAATAPECKSCASVPDPFADRGAFVSLSGTEGEAHDLCELLADVTVVEGAAATVDAVLGLRHPAILHIATHGFLSAVDEPVVVGESAFLPMTGMFILSSEKVRLANPMYFAGLAFAGANKRRPGTGTGILTAQELAGLDLEGTELVVLSACETGLGTVTAGEEFTGLRRALAIAGAATQVTSLWKVNDLATRALMAHFYRGLVEGLGRSEALVRAQRLIEGDPEHPEWHHPFFWSAFALSGEWQPIRGHLARRDMA